MRKILFATMALLAGSLQSLIPGTTVMAQEGHRQLGAHVHGHGTLNIVLEGKQVAMELSIPGMDIVGFGHKPSTPEQKLVLKKARQTIANGLTLFVLPDAAQCKQISSKVGVPGHKHNEPEAEHDGKEKHQEHSEFHAKYELECASSANLTSIRFAFFEQFPRSKELVVAIITPNSQSLHKVNRNKPVLEGLAK